MKALADSEGVEATVIGEFTQDKKLTVCYGGDIMGQLDMDFMHDGMPRIHQKAVWRKKAKIPNPKLTAKKIAQIFSGRKINVGKTLRALLAHPNIASKKWIVQQYRSHEVRRTRLTVIKPFVELYAARSLDACVFRPLLHKPQGVVVSVMDLIPSYGDLDAYWMTALAIDEALRNLVAVGGDQRLTLQRFWIIFVGAIPKMMKNWPPSCAPAKPVMTCPRGLAFLLFPARIV